MEVCCEDLDPESQRKRTVQNVLDLRQNLEETMSSLRGTQLSQSCLDSSVCYDSDETNARSISSLSNRSSPLSWRHGQSSPRLQAGDAPSSTGSRYVSGSKASSQYTSHTMPARCSSRLSHTSRSEFIEGLDAGDSDLKSGYLSDSDVLCKSLNDDDDDDDNLANGWDESSSISSGLSDGSEELNASSSLNSLPSTPVGSRRNSSVMLRTDAEKRSLVESGLAWYSEDSKSLRTADGVYDTGSLKSEPSSKWRKTRLPDGSAQDKTGKGELKKPQSLGQPGSFKKSRNPPVGVTSPITHTSQSVLKVAVSKGDTKAVDKVKMSVKATSLQRSRSDAGRDNEHRKPPSGLVKPSAGASLGYKKPPTTGTATVLTAGGATITSGSATVGKTPKSSGIPIKPVPGGGGRKNSLDASGSEQGFLAPNARGSIQYRSLPRPAKSSTMSLTGRPSSRPVSGSIDVCLLTLKPVPPLSNTMPTRGRDGGGLKAASRPSTTGPVNQTDREKEKERAKAKADLEISCLKAENQSDSCGETVEKIHRVRRTSTSKYPELCSPTSTPRLLSSKSLVHPPSLAHLDKLNSNSLDSCITIHDLPPKIPPYSKLQDLACSRVSPRLTPSPAPVLHIDSPSCFSGQTLSVSSSPILYPKMSGLHRSMESLPLHMSVPTKPDLGERDEARSTGTWGAGSRTSITLGNSLQTDRNTFPKKELSRYGSGQSEGEVKERRHSHTITSMTDSESPPQLPSPTHVTQPFLGKTPPTNVVAPIPSSGSGSQITRSNSIPANDMGYELYGTSPLGSSLSLADRPKSMMRSGSFREPSEDVHGSVLSLASNASSNYSSTEERMQGEQIRILRRELESSHDKVTNLTNQLSANANLVAAFEQSLALMTARLQSLSVTSEQKDSELQDMRETIEVLKVKNTEAQSIIQGALSVPETTPKELQIDRQNSSESISSLNSITSHSSAGSLKEQEAKKKKKKSWVYELRSSFNKAFSKKGSKAPYADIEEIATPVTSAPSSPQIQHHVDNASAKASTSTSGSCEGREDTENEEKGVSELRSELWEKERKLTDIRLEALSSAHQLEQLQEAMTNMQMTVENLKAENDQLKTSGPSSRPPSSTSQSSGLGSLVVSSPRQSVSSFGKTGMGQNEPYPDVFQSPTTTLQKDQSLVRVLVRIPNQHLFKDMTVENLKAENDQLKTSGPSSRPPSSTSQSSGLGSLVVSSPRQSVSSFGKTGMGQNEPYPDVFQSPTTTLQKDQSLVRVLVRIPNQHLFKDEVKQLEFFIGTVKISGRTDWFSLDSVVIQAFKEYLAVVDPGSSLGLSQDSIYSYSLSHVKRVVLVNLIYDPGDQGRYPDSSGLGLGLKEKCVDVLVFESLIPKPMMQHYISLLLKHRRLILSGPSGTGKTYLTNRLAEYLVERSAREVTPAITTTFNMHRQSCKDLQLYLADLANQIDRESSTAEIPLVVILDDVHDATSLSELVNGALTCKYHKCPYIIGTTNQPVKMTPNHGLHLSFRMVMFSNNVEPANGFLVRYLHRKLMEAEDPRSVKNEDLLRVLDWVPRLWYHLHTFLEKHSTSDFLIGPCFFLSCPVTVDEFRTWFIDLWNHSIIPYLQEGAKDGIKVHGQKSVWEDPVEWVRGSLPWPSAQQDQAKLFHLPPPSTGPGSPSQPGDDRPHKETPPSSVESDPLMAMLLKLQEAANYIESPEKETDPKLPPL
ncbi:neuron navigator 1 [Sinocyclocheilus grahami]|uniref:neuron navigator 1 n=1 Tax=Sinocyclocheilus grahami TaxID=75366 RepID=UPI0007AC8C8D|nr:PREDICTED: neuron navigator 1-like [Sinocyclocheilus grahami]